MTKTLFLVILALEILLLAQSTGAQRMESHDPAVGKQAKAGAMSGETALHTPGVEPQMLCLYTVVDGKVLPSVFSKEELESAEHLVVDGYVSGVVVLCGEEVSVSINGRALNRIERSPEGGLSIEGLEGLGMKVPPFSGIATDELFPAQSMGPGVKPYLKGGYCLFPSMSGTLIADSSRFDIAFEAEGKQFELQVRQKGFEDIHLDRALGDQGVSFRYIGTRLEELKKTHGDFQARLQAISESIASVEARFRTDLVSQVNIIDCEGIRNAVSSREGGQIWFYVDALFEESLDELRVIAAHESLHKLVAKLDLTQDSGMRKLFAELKGFDIFSSERFTLVMTGAVPSRAASEVAGPGELFFSFIDERNFITGMKGGHSGENLEEFCTSLAHSLLFLDRLEHNLNKPLIFPNTHEKPKSLSVEEKRYIAQSYARAVTCLIQALPSSLPEADASALNQTQNLLDTVLKKALKVQARFS